MLNYFDATTNYYPFGSKMPGRSITTSTFYRLGYQGQPEDEDMQSIGEYPKRNQLENEQTGFNNFELRLYDARIGGWLSPDPYNQHFSPYMAMSNNPLSFIDPDGGWDGNGNEISDQGGEMANRDAMNSIAFWEMLMNACPTCTGSELATLKMNIGFDGQLRGPNIVDGMFITGSGVKTMIGEFGQEIKRDVLYYKDVFLSDITKLFSGNGVNANISNFTGATTAALLRYEDLTITGNALNKVKSSPEAQALDLSLIARAKSDPKFGSEAFSFPYRIFKQFGGDRAQGDMEDQLKGFWKEQYRATWVVASHEVSWLIRGAYVNGRVAVDPNGNISISHSIIDKLDLRPSIITERGFYNDVISVLGTMWHDVFGASEPTIRANWISKY